MAEQSDRPTGRIADASGRGLLSLLRGLITDLTGYAISLMPLITDCPGHAQDKKGQGVFEDALRCLRRMRVSVRPAALLTPAYGRSLNRSSMPFTACI